jgi:hypothetical protein
MICDEVSDKKVYKTQVTPRFKVTCPVKESDIIDNDLLKCYLLCVIILDYIFKTRFMQSIERTIKRHIIGN